MSRSGKWIICGILLLGGLLLLVYLRFTNDPLNQVYFYQPWQISSNTYQTGVARWARRPFDGYHLVLKYGITQFEARYGEIPGFVTTTCDVETNVADRNEQQVQVVRNSCAAGSDAPHSIAEVFALFKERATRPTGKAPQRGQVYGCYSIDTGYLDLVDGQYDPQLGYPNQIQNVPQWWPLGNCFTSLLLMPTERDMQPSVQITVTELTPLH